MTDADDDLREFHQALRDGYYAIGDAHAAYAATMVDPIDPDPIDPVDPIDPDPIDPVDPVDPIDPDPIDPPPAGGPWNPDTYLSDLDPNSRYNGTKGRYPVSTRNPHSVCPHPDNVGAKGNLTPASSRSISTGGHVFENKHFTGTFTVTGNADVTFNNCTIEGTSDYVLRIKDDATVNFDQLTILAAGSRPSAAWHHSGKLFAGRRLLTMGGADGGKPYGPTHITDSLMGWCYKQDGSHNDVIQIRGGKDMHFERVGFFGPLRMSTSCIISQADTAPIEGLTVIDCYLSGGGYAFYTKDKNNRHGVATIRDCVYETNSFQYGPASSNIGSRRDETGRINY